MVRWVILYRLNKNTSPEAFYYDVREAASESTEGMSEITGFVRHGINPKCNLMGYLVNGFSDGSTDTGAGFLVFQRCRVYVNYTAIPSIRRDIFPF